MTAVSKVPAGSHEGADFLVQHLLGHSPEMQQVRMLARRAATLDAPVLIDGETGTGKEIVAQALHTLRPRRGKLVAVNVADLRADLAEAELFGVVLGAFTGATNRPGRLELAHEGTLLLDEAADLPLAIQARLLRVLETGVYSRVGEPRERSARFRLVVTVQRSPSVLVTDQRWRQDFFFRLTRLHLKLPPLRARGSDVVVLANHFLARHGCGSLPPEASAELLSHDWPGNVRELAHAVERAVFMSGSRSISAAAVVEAARVTLDDAASPAPPPGTRITRSRPTGGRFSETMRVAERAHLQDVLREHGYRVREAAAALGITRAHLYRRIRELRLQLHPQASR